MVERLTAADRDAAVQILQQRLQMDQLRSLLDRDVAQIVRLTEQASGWPGTLPSSAELAAFLVDLLGIDLLQDRLIRIYLTHTLVADQIKVLAAWGGEAIPSTLFAQVEQIVSRRWAPGRPWARQFVAMFGFPEVFAGLAGSPIGPAMEEVEPRVPLRDMHDYQHELVRHVHAILRAREGKNRAILSLPTGAGKTRTVVEALLSWWGMDATVKPLLLWIAQSEELCEQALEAFREVWVDRGGRGSRTTLRLFRYWGSYQALPEDVTDGVIVASIQKLYELLQTDQGTEALARLADDTAAIVIDEAHHATAPSYSTVLETFGITFGRDPSSLTPLLGLTATPYRGSNVDENRRLARRFHGQLLIPILLGDDPISTLRARGILSRVEHRVLPTGRSFALTDVEAQRFQQLGQLPDSFLRKIGQDALRNALLLKTLMDLPTDWPVLCFTCSVEHARALAVLLRRSGRSAAVVTGETRRATRRQLIADFRSGHIQVLCNYGVLTTGFDAPKIRAVVIARPTTSVVLYEQMIGRGVRGPNNGGTEACLVVDLADNITRFQGQMAYTRMREFWS